MLQSSDIVGTLTHLQLLSFLGEYGGNVSIDDGALIAILLAVQFFFYPDVRLRVGYIAISAAVAA